MLFILGFILSYVLTLPVRAMNTVRVISKQQFDLVDHTVNGMPRADIWKLIRYEFLADLRVLLGEAAGDWIAAKVFRLSKTPLFQATLFVKDFEPLKVKESPGSFEASGPTGRVSIKASDGARVSGISAGGVYVGDITVPPSAAKKPRAPRKPRSKKPVA